MQFETFQQSIKDNKLPAGISVYLQAMWYDGTSNWSKAHSLVDSMEDATASWVHAYLHRKEGDIWNADYWYKRAGQSRKDISLEAEWTGLLEKLIA